MEEHAKLGVKGNMNPLAIKPVYLDMADWLAHQSEPTQPSQPALRD